MDSIVTVVIINQLCDKKSRLKFLDMKFLLEMTGFIVLEGPVSFDASETGRYQELIMMNKGIARGVKGDFVYDESMESIPQFVNSITREAIFRFPNVGARGRLYYSPKIRRALYSIKYLYANRRTKYTRVDLLKQSILTLVEICDKLEKELAAESLSWRVYYAYLYLADCVNEGMYKLRAFQYYPYKELEPYIRKAGELAPGNDSIGLLQANLIRNDNLLFERAEDFYEALCGSKEFGVRYWALYALGELEQERAERKWGREGGGRGEAEKSQYFNNAMQYYAVCREMKKDEIRIIYKLALQDERRGHGSQEKLGEAIRKYGEIIKAVNRKRPEEVNTLEFEYLYKSYIRRGWAYQMKGDYEAASSDYDMAERCWLGIGSYLLFAYIYGSHSATVKAVLEAKYADRDEVIGSNKSLIERKQKRESFELWEAKL